VTSSQRTSKSRPTAEKGVDFGLAKAIWGREVNQDLSQSAAVTDPETVAGHTVGTPGYISPEQALERRRYFARWPEARVCP
jgi:hypothetical protein